MSEDKLQSQDNSSKALQEGSVYYVYYLFDLFKLFFEVYEHLKIVFTHYLHIKIMIIIPYMCVCLYSLQKLVWDNGTGWL